MLASRLCLGGPADWGDVPGWIEALATAAAVLVAIPSTVLALRAYQQQVQDQQRAQAVLVNIWLERLLGTDSNIIQVANSSSSPVYDVEVGARLDGDILRWNRHVIPPQRTVEFHFEPLAFERSGVAEDDRWKTDPMVEYRVTFVDSAGRRWTRNDAELYLDCQH